MAGRKPYTPTPEHIETVRALKEKGASDRVCAEAIGVSAFTFKKYKKTFFTQPIKNGLEDRRKKLLAIAEDTLEKEIKGYWIEEETTTTRTIGDTETVETKIQRKWMRPSTPMNIMTLINCSTETDEINWQPTNKAETKSLFSL